MLTINPMVRSTKRFGFARISAVSELREEKLRFLANEFNHRIKNLLAVIQAIARQTAKRSENLKDFEIRFSQRLQGLSRCMDLLLQEDQHAASVADLVRSQLEPFGEVDGERISATGPDVLLSPEAALNIGLALHELATNATKHGALSVPQGVVSVQWELRLSDLRPTCFRLTWRESEGPEVVPPTRQGFGHVVLERMTAQTLQGTVNHEFQTSGVSWTLEVPAAAVLMLRSVERVCDLPIARHRY